MSDTSLLFSILARDKASGVLAKISDKAKIAMAAMTTAAVAIAKDAVGAASDLSETQSKVKQIFGGSADAVIAFSQTAAKGLGQSQQAALDAASTFAIYGKAAGKTGADLVGFSTKLTSLASDLASFHNTSPQEAIEAIGAALRGEAEPMQRYGVLLNDATMRDAALRMGLIKTTSQALTPQQKVLAAQAVIMGQTKDAQGDFARTSSGLANQQRVLTAEFENAKTSLGTALLPAMLQFAHVLTATADWIKENHTWLLPLVGVLGGLAGIVYGIVSAQRAWVTVQTALNLVLSANPIGLIIIAIAALVAGLIWAWNHSETFRKIVTAAWQWIWDKVKAVGAWFSDTLWPWIKGVWDKITSANEVLKQKVSAGWDWIWDKIKAPAVWIVNTLLPWILGVWDKITHGNEVLKSKITGAWDALLAFLKGIPGKIGALASGMWDGIKNSFRSVINWIISKWNGLSFTIPSVNVPGLGKVGGVTLRVPQIPLLATGGTVQRAGMAIVGEAGPELVNLGRGASVTPLSRAQAQVVNHYWTVNVPPTVNKGEVGREINEALAAFKRGGGKLVTP